MSIGETLRARGLRPKKAYGQNFLVDANAARRIAEAATTPEGGLVLEIGPGLGALTGPLLERAGRVVAVERDRDLVPILSEQLADAIAAGRLEIILADALKQDWAALLAPGPAPRVLAGNLPYSITGLLMERATQLADVIDGAVFMVQAEVADRLAAAPDTESYGALTVFVQAAFDVKRLLSVRSGAFHPRPDVDSAVVVFTPRRPRRAAETPAFREAVRRAFQARRKTLRNAWKDLYGWPKDELERHAADAGISLDARGETLPVEAFAAIAAARGPSQGSS